MAEVVKMPRLSDTMTEGVIAQWHKKVGDPVKKGDVLAEIETDKATMELESYQDGTILHLGGSNGAKLQVDDLLVIIGKQGEDISNLLNGKPVEAAPAKEELPTQQPKEEAKADAPKADAPKATDKDYSALEEVVLMPRLSDTMTEGVIASWQKNVGDDVKKGDILAEIETDKATMELESYKDGKLLHQGAKAGDKIQVNDLLAIIGKEGLNVAEIVAALTNGGATPAKPPIEAKEPTATAAPSGQAPNPIEISPAAQQVVNEGRIFASPLAKKMAEEKGVDLKYIKGSGDNGRITKSDVENYQPATASQPKDKSDTAKSAATATVAAAYGEVSYEDVPVSQMRKVIAKRLTESKFGAPEFYVTMAIDMDAAVAARTKINENAKVKISFNDLVLKAVALSLKQHPKINSSWLGDKIRMNHHVNIGVAVAVEDGLLVPVVRFADTKNLSQISQEVKDFAQKAKDKKLQPADWEGSTFTISNLGMFGVDEFTAIINPPDSCILAVGGISKVPVVKDGTVVPGNVMKLTLTCDHRTVDGASGAAFLLTVKSFLEEPLRMLL